MLSNIDLSIIILSYNSSFWLEKTLSTLDSFYLRKTKLKVEVTVVDNASNDDSIAMVKKTFPWVNLIENKDNIGYAAGNNIALRKVQSQYVMLLNSDVEFTKDSNLDLLVDFMNENKQVGVITPAVRLINGELDPACHRGEPTLWTSLTYFAGLEKLFPRLPLFSGYHQWYKNLEDIHYIDACSGAAMIVRKSAMDKVGFLDERFFMYAEDLDWCKRFRDQHYGIVFHPGVSVTHHKYKSGIHSSDHKIVKKTTNHFYDTMLQYYDKHYHPHMPVGAKGIVRTVLNYILTIKKGVS